MPWPSRQWQVADAEWKELTAITSLGLVPVIASQWGNSIPPQKNGFFGGKLSINEVEIRKRSKKKMSTSQFGVHDSTIEPLEVVLRFTILPSVIQPHKSLISHYRPKGETKYSSEMSKSRKQEHAKQGSAQRCFEKSIFHTKRDVVSNNRQHQTSPRPPKKDEQPQGSVILLCRSGFGWAARVLQ